MPQELVAALLPAYAGSGGTVPEIVVGRVPDEMPFEVPRPANARVVGALSRPGAGTLVLSVPERPLEAMKAYQELLRRTGWDDPARERGSGFQPSDIVHSGTFCQGENRAISTTAAERSNKETFLQVQYYDRGGRYAPCSDRQMESMAPRRGPLPTFYPPPNTSIADAHAGGGRSFTEASARLETELKPAQLVAHYGAQLRAAGWAPRSDPSGNEIVGQNWRIEDRRGKAWIGVLVAIAIPDSDDRAMLFRVMSPDVGRRPE